MSVRGIYRGKSPIGNATPTNAPVYVDSDDNQLKLVPAGSGSTEKIVPVSDVALNISGQVAAATLALAAADNGKTIFLNSSTEFATTLPAPFLGARFTFIVAAAPSGASYTVVTSGAAEIIIGKVHSAAGDAGDVENTAGGTTITFVDGQAVAGDRVDLESDGTNWYVVGFASVAAGITITG